MHLRLALAVLLAVPAVAFADDPPASGPGGAAPRAPASAGADDPLTALAAGPLGRADRVVVARVTVLRAGATGGFTLARAEVERVLKGAPSPRGAPESITVFVRGPHPTMDPRHPSAPYLGEGDQGRRVLFLVKSPSGSGWDLDATFAVDGPVGEEKLETLAAEVALAAVADPAERRRRTLEHLLGLLASDRSWSRLHAARELGALASSSPECFPDAVADRLARARKRSVEPALRDLLGSVLVTLHRPVEPLGRGGESLLGPLDPSGAPLPPAAASPPPASPPGAGSAPEAGTPPPPRPRTPAVDVAALRAALAAAKDPDARVDAVTRLAKGAGRNAVPDLEALVGDPEALVRERAVVLLADAGDAAVWPRLRERYGREEDVAVREAYVRAAGLLGEAGDVPWVAARGREPGLRVAASFALARLRTPSALEALAQYRRQALEAASPDEAFAKQVDYLTSEAFVETERRAGRRTGRVAAPGADAGAPPPPPSPPPDAVPPR